MLDTKSEHNEVCPKCGSSETECIDGRLTWICFKCRGRFSLTKSEGFVPQKIFLSYAHMVDGNDDDTAVLVESIQQMLLAAGHEAWIDKQQLKGGADWRQGITQGILSSDRVLAFLSPRSVRDPGVCLDEIGIAMGVKHGAIATLLSDKRVKNCSPASVTHIQYLDLTDWKNVKAQGEPVWEPWLADKTSQILDIIEKNTGFAGEIEDLAKRLQPLPTSAKIGALTAKGFVGRQWVMQAINDWRLEQLNKKLFWLKAGPGMGKSAIAAHLAHFAKTQTVAVHFCEYNVPESRNAARFVQNLAFMLAARLADYRKLLTYQLVNLEKPLSEFNADELLRRLVLEPLRNKIDGGQQDDRLLVVVDALDEADADLPALLAKYIAEFPDWLGFVATSRPETAGVLAQFKPMELAMDDARNLQDLKALLDEWQCQQPSAALNPAARQALLDASEGNILYLVYARDGVQSGLLDLTQPHSFPSGIAGLYRQWLERQFGAQPQTKPEWVQNSYPLLELVCASPLPLPMWLASRLLNWQGQGRIEAMLPLGSLLEQNNLTLRLCHRSLSEWLQDPQSSNNPFWVNTEEARIKLAQGLLSELPAALKDREPGYVHLALPALLQLIPGQDRKQLWPEDWPAAMYQLGKLDEFLGNSYSKDANAGCLDLRKLMVIECIQVLGERHPDTLGSMNNLAMRLSAEGDLTGARVLQERTLSLQREVLGERHSHTLASMLNLANTLAALGDLMSARALQEETLASSRGVLGERHPDTLSIMNNLAETLFAQGDLTSARVLHEETLVLRRGVLGEHHQDTLASMGNLSNILYSQGDLNAARALREHTLALESEVLGNCNPQTFASSHNLASLLYDQGDVITARLLCEQALVLQRELLGEHHPDVLTSMSTLANMISSQGNWSDARVLEEKVLYLRRKVLGERHPKTLASMNGLATMLNSQGDLLAGRLLKEETLTLRREVLGNRHPDTLASMSELAMTLNAQGNLTAARLLKEETLILRREVLGDRHPDTLASMTGLAITLNAQGDLSASRTLQEETLILQREVLGERHPSTFRTMHNLADTIASQGDLTAARMLQEQTLTLRLKVLGDRHPDTLASMSALAITLNAQGDLTAARLLKEETLILRREVLGDRHPDTLASMTGLAITLNAQGDLSASRTLQEETLILQREVLGERHPNTFGSMNNLANILSSLGDLSAARLLQEHTLVLQREVLGESHPDTLASMYNLANTLFSQGDLVGARELQEKTLDLLREVLGQQHPYTLASMATLSLTLSSQGDLASACELQRQTLALQFEVLGDRHPETIVSMSNLAKTLSSLGELSAASEIQKQILALRVEVLGDSHPDTINSMNNLAISLYRQGELLSAGALFEQTLALRIEVLGDSHPDTIDSIKNLAASRHEAEA